MIPGATRLLDGRVLLLGLIGALVPAGACGTDPPTDYGEIVVYVDTDLPVPRMANRLRVDVFGGDGTWYESRDLSLATAEAWPASFSVLSRDLGRESRVMLRLRAYPAGAVRDYRGELFQGRPTFEPVDCYDNELVTS